MSNSDVIRDAQKQARSKIVSTWAQVANKYTVGWGGPLEAVEMKFPHVTDAMSDVRARVSPTLPLIIYQTRESPPESTSVAVPYDSDCKCRIVATGELSQPERTLLGEFAQAIWFLILSESLPDPRAGKEFETKLIEMTDAKLIGL
jgi:hypothetical protein